MLRLRVARLYGDGLQNLMPGAELHALRRDAEASRVRVTYHVRSDANSIEARARSIAIEQSIELPLEVVDDAFVRAEIVGNVSAITDLGNGIFEVGIMLATQTMPPEPGQLFNMLFGNTSLHDDVTLYDVALPHSYLDAFRGPSVGLDGLRTLVGGQGRALTATALKPQGLSAAELARIAGAAAYGGIDIIKDDHGLADQTYSRFADRVAACSAAVAAANRATGRSVAYAPSLSGSLDQLRVQIAIARDAGLGVCLIAPMVVGLPSFHALAREAGDMALLAHPSLAGASRIAPPLLLGRIFRLLGADGTIFPNHGGRFSYSAATCQAIATAATEDWSDLEASVPTPAGGMSLDRVDEMLDFYGRDCMLLIGGSLLAQRDQITNAATRFTDKVARYGQ
jgi:ribulose-bisphosphate carboxylase large chain